MERFGGMDGTWREVRMVTRVLGKGWAGGRAWGSWMVDVSLLRASGFREEQRLTEDGFYRCGLGLRSNPATTPQPHTHTPTGLLKKHIVTSPVLFGH